MDAAYFENLLLEVDAPPKGDSDTAQDLTPVNIEAEQRPGDPRVLAWARAL